MIAWADVLNLTTNSADDAGCFYTDHAFWEFDDLHGDKNVLIILSILAVEMKESLELP